MKNMQTAGSERKPKSEAAFGKKDPAWSDRIWTEEASSRKEETNEISSMY